jgi:hypothetical protein
MQERAGAGFFPQRGLITETLAMLSLPVLSSVALVEAFHRTRKQRKSGVRIAIPEPGTCRVAIPPL